ncbi:hypothetical protein N8870_05430 [Alphaproteobacteria bacterium]|nr:hypothetical protein [Alphaproteobacteria bacterium]
MELTIRNYKKLLNLAIKKFNFIEFDQDYTKNENLVIWRHDIDFSPYSALDIAKIDASQGVSSTFFFQTTSIYYNIMEREIGNIVKQISKLGHTIGLHFDYSVYKNSDEEEIKKKFAFELNILREISNCDVNIFSLHNPTTVDDYFNQKLQYCNCLNASSSKILEYFKYCSDSNGFWRFKTLEELLLDEKITKLYVLTHPIWWQDKVIPAREKILRSIDNKSRSSVSFYDNLLKTNGRKNIY